MARRSRLRPTVAERQDAFERQITAEAVRVYGYPVTDVEAIEFHLLKERLRRRYHTGTTSVPTGKPVLS